MEPFIPCSKIAKPSFDTFSSKLALAKMLSWQELDQIDHFAWGVGNKRCRASCVLDVSSDTYDTLRMICGDEVCFPSLFFWAFYRWSFISKTTVHNFSAAGDPSLHWGNQYSVRAGCVCLLANTQTRARADPRVFGGLEEWYPWPGYSPGPSKTCIKFLQALLHQKQILIECLHAFRLFESVVSFLMSSGVNMYYREDMFNRAPISRLVLFLVSETSFGGNVEAIPFQFQQLDLETARIIRERSIAGATPLHLNDNVVRSYSTVLHSQGAWFKTWW